MKAMKILKFGGSSVSTAERIKDVGRIVLRVAKKERIVVVVSAFQGITNQLLECAQSAANGKANFETLFTTIAKRHRGILKELHGKRPEKKTSTMVEQMLAELHDALHGIYLLRDSPPRALDLTASFGERLSAVIIASYLNRSRHAQFVDARDLIVTDDQFTSATVLFDQTNAKTRKYFKELNVGGKRSVLPVV